MTSPIINLQHFQSNVPSYDNYNNYYFPVITQDITDHGIISIDMSIDHYTQMITYRYTMGRNNIVTHVIQLSIHEFIVPEFISYDNGYPELVTTLENNERYNYFLIQGMIQREIKLVYNHSISNF